MWHFLFLAFLWHSGKGGFVVLSLVFLASLLYAVAHVHRAEDLLVLISPNTVLDQSGPDQHVVLHR